MSRALVHLSDIHFGRVDTATLGPLIETVRRIAPHVVVVSGDLTQRARTAEFQEARAFLNQLPQPQIVVPGMMPIVFSSSSNISRSFARPMPSRMRLRILCIQAAPSRQGVHCPQDSCA